jgi:hypothetical protein
MLSAPPPPQKLAATPPAQTSAKVPQREAPRVAAPPPAAPAARPETQEPAEKPADKPAEKPVDKPAEKTAENPAPAKSTANNPVQKPAETPARKPAPQTAAEKPATAPAKPAKPAIDVPARIAAGERALVSASLTDARRIYRELLDAGGHEHATWIRVAEGLYRSRDFAGALTAFQHVGALRPGEEAYRYYVAVAAYETGQYERAKRELAAALPYIEITPDVERYRAKIDGAR